MSATLGDSLQSFHGPERSSSRSHKYGTMMADEDNPGNPGSTIPAGKIGRGRTRDSLRELVSQALADKLRVRGGEDKPWMKSFGKLRGLHRETARIDRIIENEFGRIEPEDWQ